MGNIKRLLNRFEELEIDGFMITGDWNRRYMSNFTGSNGVILVNKSTVQLITDYRYFEQAQAESEFEVILHAEHTGHKHKIYDEVAKQIKKLNIKRLGFEQQHINFGNYTKLKHSISSELIPTYDVVEDLRMIKTPEEIEKIRISSEITDQAFLHVLDMIKPGVKENEVSDALVNFIRKNGATHSTFNPTVASGKRGSFPHGRASDKVIEKGDMITIDFGTNYKGYWSDISRTIAVGEPSAQMKEIHEVLLKSFNNCLTNIKPGITDREVDRLMREPLIESGYEKNSGTGTGHGIGLEVHEKPLFSVDLDKKLEANMTITIEPGIYLPNIGGGRVEDMILVTNDGYEVLSPSTKELIIL